MTSKDVRVAAQLLTGLQIEEVTGFLWLKDALLHIYTNHVLACPEWKDDFTCDEDNNFYQFKRPLARLEKVNISGDRWPMTEPHYTAEKDGVLFYYKGDYDITYRYIPEMPKTASDDFVLDDRYAQYLRYYLAARIRARVYGQGDPDSQMYEQLFNTYLDEADAAIMRTRRRGRRMPARI